MPRSTHRSSHGFTLVELAIVLVIVGLLVGGITAGRFMIRAGEIQSVINEIGRYRTAYDQFKSQYGGLPGDIIDAEDYWGTDPSGCPSNTDRSPKTTTCNGDGDNTIMGATSMEPFRAWQHLANAGMITGKYSGVPGATNGTWNDVDFPTNAPAARPSQTGYFMYNVGTITGGADARYYDGNYRSVLLFGLRSAGAYPLGAALKPQEALEIDDKLDDMQPGFGIIRAMKSGTNPNCTTSNTAGSAHYNVTNGERTCALLTVLQE